MRTQKEIQQRAPFWLASLLFLNGVLMTLDARDEVTKQRVIRVWAQAVASPFQWAISGAGNTGVGFFTGLANLRNAVSENSQLKERVASLETELRASQEAVNENARLQQLLDLQSGAGYGVVAARVIARDPSAWFDSVVINRGRLAGVELNMAVATPTGIVGRVVATSPVTAQVMLITEDRSSVGAVVGQIGASEALGTVEGRDSSDGLLNMSYVSGLEKVAQGDRVWTTGQDGIYPPGLSIGEVQDVKEGTANTPHTITIKPSARLNALEEVAVLQYRPPARVPLDQSLPNIVKETK